MQCVKLATEVLLQIVHLGVAVVAWRDGVVGAGFLYLIEFDLAVFTSLLRSTGLQIAATAAAAVVVGFIGRHVDKVLFANHFFNHKPQIVRTCVAVSFANELAGILNGELAFQILVPIRVNWEFSFSNPLSVVADNASDFKFVCNVVFFQSRPDRE